MPIGFLALASLLVTMASRPQPVPAAPITTPCPATTPAEARFQVRVITSVTDARSSLPHEAAAGKGRQTIPYRMLMSKTEVAAFVRRLREDSRTDVLALPRVTVELGQQARLQIADQHAYTVCVPPQYPDLPDTKVTLATGLQATMVPHQINALRTVFHFRLSIRSPVDLNRPEEVTSGQSPPTVSLFGVESIEAIPAGKIMLVGGWVMPRVHRSEDHFPVHESAAGNGPPICCDQERLEMRQCWLLLNAEMVTALEEEGKGS